MSREEVDSRRPALKQEAYLGDCPSVVGLSPTLKVLSVTFLRTTFASLTCAKRRRVPLLRPGDSHHLYYYIGYLSFFAQEFIWLQPTEGVC